MATDKARYTVSVDDDLFQQIEDFRFEHRFQTRSKATVELIRMGLEALQKEQGGISQGEDDGPSSRLMAPNEPQV